MLLPGLLQLIWPSLCVACDAPTIEEQPLCDLCAQSLEPIVQACRQCGIPLAPGEFERPAVSCLACGASAPHWTSARSPFLFGGQLAVAVRRWKFGRRPELTRSLAQLLAPSLAELPAAVDVLVPVPLHPRRLRQRQFNQASLLARAAQRNGPPVRELLDRVRDTPPQTRLGATERRANVRNAFAMARRANVKDLHLVLVDDVMTTGATAEACARVCFRAGAARVDVLTLTRAPL